MTIEDINNLLSVLDKNRNREQMLNTAFALLEYMGLPLPAERKERVLAPRLEKLKDFLITHPLTRQPQFYRLTEKDQHVNIRLAVLKKFRKDQLLQLIDKENPLNFQNAPPIIQKTPSAPPYLIHLVATPEFDRIYIVLSKGDQKRIVSLRKKLTQTQFQKILPQWKNVGSKSKIEIAEQLWKSFDLKEVNKDFYKLIKEQFDGLLGIAETQQPKADKEEVKQFAVRLIGRYIFCWFLKEKGIISEKLLSSNTITEHKKDFFQTFLSQLFFKTLNEEVQTRSPFSTGTTLDELYTNIPYLNGGLFDFHPDDKLFKKLDLNDWLIAFVKVLENFDFTVDESNSQYQQVAIDPEMLGRIFENLLASQNEETSSLANQRKAFGAFYTPREIVDYMVNESLRAHLETRLMPAEQNDATGNTLHEPLVAYKGSLFADVEPQQTQLNLSGKELAEKADNERKRARIKSQLDKLFAPDCTENPFDKSETLAVRNALKDITILDPACGSGAFPMGVLLRLMELRQITGHGHKNNYELKNEILSRNIFGVDIMPMAVEIARLRAWLSLVLESEYKPNDRKNNFGVAALPNLDFKFVCANSLIDSGYDDFLNKFDVQLKITSSVLFFLNKEIQHLQKIRNDYFDTKGDQTLKRKLIAEFFEHRNYIKQNFNVEKFEIDEKTGKQKKTKSSTGENYGLKDFLNKVDDWNPFDDSKPSSFFSSAWMFGIRDGFDVVIGNPPYVQMQKDNGKLANQLKNGGYLTYERTGDIYAIFYELGFKVLKQNGVHVFITSSQWLKANYGKSLRKLFLSKNPLKLIALGPGMFETAVVDTNILIAKNTSNQNQLQGSIINNPEQINHLNELVFQPMPYVTMENWAILNLNNQSINEKIKAHGKPLSDWKIQINFGIKTGYNEAFIIDEAKRNELIKTDAKSEKIIRPILKGREIDKYISNWENDYIVFIPWHFPLQDNPKITGASAEAEKEFSKQYKVIYEYLKSHKEGLSERNKDETGIRYEWYALQRSASTYRDEFSKEKVIWKRIGSKLRFSFSDKEIYCLDSTCIATGEKIKYLTGLLNSKLCNYQLLETAPKTGMGDLIISVQALEPLLVHYPTEKEQTQIEKLVDEILIKKQQNQDTTELEKEIDVMVYKLYELTYAEVKVIDKDFWMSDEEYGKVEIK